MANAEASAMSYTKRTVRSNRMYIAAKMCVSPAIPVQYRLFAAALMGCIQTAHRVLSTRAFEDLARDLLAR